MTTKKRRSAMIVAVPLGLLASGALVYQSSSAAFTASTDSGTQTWTAGTVALSNNSANSLTWATTNLKPGATLTRCVLVTYSGNLDANVSLYPTGYTATDTTSADLQDVLKFTVDAYDGDQTAATTDGCKASMPTPLTLTNPVSAEPATTFATRTAFTAGARTSAAVTATAPHHLTYRITYLVDSGATNDAQTDSVAFKFTWEAQNA